MYKKYKCLELRFYVEKLVSITLSLNQSEKSAVTGLPKSSTSELSAESGPLLFPGITYKLFKMFVKNIS